jgi:Cytochrome C oxidase, cbb3-type, subunit III
MIIEEASSTAGNGFGRRMRGRCCVWLLLLILIPGLALAYFAWVFTRDEAVTYADIEQHFKYGSLGGERVLGFPYWIWMALPQVCPHKLPGPGYASLGMVYEKDRDLPIGMSKRRHMGIDRVFLNCAACHASTVRDTPQSAPRVVLGMPAYTFDLMGFEKFFFECAADSRFSKNWIVPEIQRLGADLNLIERRLIYPIAIAFMRDNVLGLRGRFTFVYLQPHWGPGRVDTFNSAKANFNFPWDRVPRQELIGTADFPSIWNQRTKKGMQLHWDGNNSKVEERNRNAAFGAGTTPPTIEHGEVRRIEDWLLDFKPPPYPYPINQDLAQKGAAIYKKYCAGCHGASGQDFNGEAVGKVVPIEDIGTDRWRLDSYTEELSVNLGTMYAGYEEHRFKHFRKTYGYANLPLDGLWLRAPYLHNGSVPTLRDLLEPAVNRPTVFYRGYDVYDPKKVGFVSDVQEEKGRKYFTFDTSVPGNGNQGHEGRRYGTELPPGEKAALVEYLKTF